MEPKKTKAPRKKMSMFFIREDLKKMLKIHSAKKQKSMSQVLTELLQVFFKVS